MSDYALIKDSVVSNIAVWDGQGNIFDDFTTIEISGDFRPNIGDVYLDGIIYSKPSDSYEYNFDWDGLVWVITEESAKKKEQDDVVSNLVIAQSEYNRASEKITWLQQRIDDEDYNGTNTEESVLAEKSTWTTYRKALRAYIAAADGSKPLPEPPVK